MPFADVLVEMYGFRAPPGALKGMDGGQGGVRREKPEPSKKVGGGVLRRPKQKVLRRVLRTF